MRWATPRNAAMPRRMASGAIPVHSTQAVAASTFSTLWAPRSAISVTGQMRSTCPLSRATIQPVVDEDAGDRPGGAG